MQISTTDHRHWHQIFALALVNLRTRISREMFYNKERWKSLTQKEKILPEPLRLEVHDKAEWGIKMLTTFKIKTGWGRQVKARKNPPYLTVSLGYLGFLNFIPFLFLQIVYFRLAKGDVSHGEWSQRTNPT